MTMLDRMRRHRNWLKWSLALVCLAFVIFYIPDFLRGTDANAAATDTVALVAGHEIRGADFRRTYQAQLQAYRTAYGGKMSEKLRLAVTEWLSVSDRELAQEYRRRNDKVKLAVVTFNADTFRPDVTVPDTDVTTYFEAHKADFKIPEKRKVKYALVDVESLRTKINVPSADVERFYNENSEQYSTPDQVRASHILLKTEGKDDAAVKAKAEEILKQAKSGADFAELAKKHSEDESNAKNGGDLDFFGRGRMVPEFDQAVFAMEPGQMSDLVKTEYGYHIIKLTDKKVGGTKKLDEVRQQITEQLAFDRAQTQAATLAETLEKQIKKPADLDTVAKAQDLTVQETGFFARD